jgi:hypothetical protein
LVFWQERTGYARVTVPLDSFMPAVRFGALDRIWMLN